MDTCKQIVQGTKQIIQLQEILLAIGDFDWGEARVLVGKEDINEV